jgi:hypothetical protein
MILFIIIVAIIVIAILSNQDGRKPQIANETLISAINSSYQLLIDIVISSYDLRVCPKCQRKKMELQTVSENGQSIEYTCVYCNTKINSNLLQGKDGTKAFSQISEIKRLLTILVKNSGNKYFYRRINSTLLK